MGHFRLCFAVGCLLIVSIAAPLAQASGVDPRERFEVASIKRNLSGSGSMSVGSPPGRFVAVNVDAVTLIQNAYPYQRFRIVGAPSWALSERFDVTAVGADGQTVEQSQLRVRSLLAERFNLVAQCTGDRSDRAAKRELTQTPDV